MAVKKKAGKKKAAKKQATGRAKINGYNKANQMERQISRFMEKVPLNKATADEYHKLASGLKGFAQRLEALALNELGYKVVTIARANPGMGAEDED